MPGLTAPIIPIDESIGTTPKINTYVPSVAKPELFNPGFNLFNANRVNTDPKGSPDFFSATLNDRYPLFNSTINNEEAYAQNQGALSQWGAGLAKFGINLATSFAEQMLSIPRLFNEITNDQKDLNKYNSWIDGLAEYREKSNDVFANYQTEYEKEHPFLSAIPFAPGSANFWADKFTANLGFTAGMITGALVQDAAVSLVTEGVGEIPLITNQIGKAALWVNKILSSEGKASFAFKGVLESINAKKAADAFLNLSASAQASKLTNAARYGLNIYTSADTEAYMEAREGYRNLKEESINDYIKEYGQPPVGQALSDIEAKATAAMNTRYALNMGLLLPSNLLQWNTFMKPFTALKNSILRDGEAATLKGASKIEILNKLTGEVGKVESNSLWSKIKEPLLNVASEGIWEEGGQYNIDKAVNDYYKNYYDPKNKAKVDDILKSTVKGFSEQFGSQEGLENMFIGALTGMLTSPVSDAYTKYKNKKAGLDSEEQADKRVMDMLNNKLVTGFFRNTRESALKANAQQEKLKEAVEKNDVFEHKNIQRDAFFDYVITHEKAGRSDLAIAKIELLRDLPIEEQRKVMEDPEATREDVSGYIDMLVSQAKEIQQTVKGVETAISNPYRYIGQSLKDPEKEKERKKNNDNYFMVEDYKTALTKFAFDIKNAQRREIEINQKLTEIHPGISNDFLKNLTSSKNLLQLAKQYEQEANDLQKQVDDKIVKKSDVSKQISKLLNNVEDIRSIFNEEDPNVANSKYISAFQKIANYELGSLGEIPIEKTSDLIKLGQDLNRIDKLKEQAKEYYNLMFSSKGFETFAKKWDVITNNLNYQPTEKMRPLEGQFEHKGVIYTIGRTYSEKGKKAVTILQEPFNGKVKVRLENNDIEFIDVNELQNKKLNKTKEELDLEKAEELKQEKELLSKYKNLLDKNSVEEDSEQTPSEEEPLGFSKDITETASTGIDPFYEKDMSSGEYGNYHRRHQSFLFNIQANSKLAAERELFKIIPITKRTEESFGLKGIIDDNYPNAIRYVYVKLNEEGGFDFIDKNGDILDKSNENILKQIIFTTAPEEDLKITTKDGDRIAAYTDLYGIGEKNIQQIISEWKTLRDNLLKANYTPENVQSFGYLFDFNISNGIGMVDNSSAKNNITDVINTLEESDLFKPLIHVKTFSNPVLENGREKVIGNGKIYYQHNGIFFFVNNRNFTEKESKNVTYAINEIVQTILNKKELDVRLTSYLEGVTRKTKKVNGVFIDVQNLKVYINAVAYDFQEISSNLDVIESTLQKMYHGVKSELLKEFQKNPNTPFLEMEWVGDKFVPKSWKSYQHYLIQKRNGVPPVTTNLIVSQENEIPLVQKYPIITNLTNILPTFGGQNIRQQNAKNKNTELSEIEKLVITDENYNTWSNVRDKSDYDDFVKQVRRTLNSFDKVLDKSKITFEYVESALSNNKAFSNKELRNKVIPLIVEKYNSKETNNNKVDDALENKKANISKSVNNTKRFSHLINIVKNHEGSFANWMRKNPSSNKEEFFKEIDEKFEDLNNIPDVSKVTKQLLSKFFLSSNAFDLEVLVSILNDTFNIINSPIVEKNTSKLKNIKISDTDEDSPFRLTDTPLNVEGDIEKEREEVIKMLPQVEMIDDLDSLIETTAGGKAWGEAVPHFIYVYQGAPFGVRYHEAFEQVFNYILLPHKQLELVEEFVQRKGTFTTYQGIVKPYSEASFKEAKEQMADEFAEYKANNEFSYKESPKTNNWFKRLLSFFKNLFFGKPQTLNEVFVKLSKGSYANSAILTPIKSERNFSEVKNMPEVLVQHALIGFTTDLFLNKWKTDADEIIDLEENPEESTKKLFDELYDRMEYWFEQGLPEYLLKSAIKKSYPAISKWFTILNDGDQYILKYNNEVIAQTKSVVFAQQKAFDHLESIQKTKEQEAAYKKYLKNQEKESLILENTLEKWSGIQDQWGNFMKELTTFLKTFDFAYTVNDEGEIQLSTEDTIQEDKIEAKDSYTSEDRIFVNGKNTASKSVKLLFATIAESEFVREQLKNDIGEIVNKYLGNNVIRDNNLLFLPSLANYAKLFNYVIKLSTNKTGIVDIVENLNKESQKKSIKLNANLSVLLSRISFQKTFKTLSDAKIKTVLQLENVLSKQSPLFLRWFSPSAGVVVSQTTNISERTEQLVSEWIASLKNSPFVQDKGKGNIQFISKKDDNFLINADNFIFLSNLGIRFNKAQFNRLPKSVQNQVNTQISAIKHIVENYTKKPLPAITTEKTIGFGENLSKLAAIYTEFVEGDALESMRDNLEGNSTSNTALPNYVSYVLNDINSATTYKNFVSVNPQYQDIYMGTSYYLNKVFFKNNKRDKDVKIQMAIVEGRKSYDSVRQLHKMTLGERTVTTINNNFQGIYNLLVNADGKIEWAVKLPELISSKSWFKGNRTSYIYGSQDHNDFVFVDEMFEVFKNEIDLARQFVHENTERNKLKALNIKDKGFEDRKIGASLRFFKGILNKDLVNLINKEYIDSVENKNISQLKQEFTEDLMNWMNTRVTNTKEVLLSEGMLDGSENNWSIKGLSSEIQQLIFGRDVIVAGGKNENKVKKLTTEQLNNLLLLREINYVFNNIELHKMFFNDPAQYEDAHKRIKSFLSGREYTHSDLKSDLNDVLNIKNNKVGDHILNPEEWGYKNHTNSLEVFTYEDVYTQSKNLQEYKDVLGKLGEAYANNNIADAQSAMTGLSYRELSQKAGYRWTKSQEKLHNWLMAWERQNLLKEGVLNNKTYSKELQKEDLQILKKPIPEKDKKGDRIAFPPLKSIISGVRWENGAAIQYLYKTSTTPLYLYFIKNTPLEAVYIDMVQNKKDMFAMESAHKVGMQEDNITSFYDDKGAIKEIKNIKTVTVDYRYLGIQVETSGLKDQQRQGSQLTKLAMQNLMQLNVPYDYIKQNKNLAFEEVYENWNNLEETDKIKYKGYRLVKEHNEVLKELAIARTEKIFKNFNIVENNGQFTIEDHSAIVEHVLNELQRRALPKNIASSLKLKNKKLEFPLEANPNFRKIKEIIWSTIEHNLTKPKMSAGGAKILVSALGYDDFKIEKINSKDVLVSSKYKFYSQGESKTEACQIAVPYIYGQKLIKFIEKEQGQSFENQKDAMKAALNYLKHSKNAKELLRGIGFRIPTQGLNSVDFFEIVEFLPPQMGDVVIFPAEITTKAGSDFDVDKMQMYLKNWYFEANGDIKTIPFLGYGEQAKNKFKNILSEKNIKEMFLNLSSTKADENAIEKLKDLDSDEDIFDIYVQSLENKYYSILEEILSLPDNFAKLITPNNADVSKNIANEVFAKREKKYKKYNKTQFERMLDSVDMTKTRQSFLSSKMDVGIPAVANTNHVLNQLDNVYTDKRIPLKHNVFNNSASFSFITTVEGDEYISERISRKIDGTVDAAKDDWLARLLGQPNMLGVSIIFDKNGCNEKEIAYYLSQPLIQEFMRQKNNEEVFPSLVDNYTSKSTFEIIKRIATNKNYLGLNETNFNKLWKNTAKEFYTLTEMEPMLGVPLKDLTVEQKEKQLLMLKDFIELQKIASDNFNVVNGTNWDTASFNKPELVENKLYQNQEALNQTSLKNVSGILNNSFLGELKNSIVKTNEGLLSMLSLENQMLSKEILNRVSLKLKTQFFKTDDYARYMEQANQSLLDFAIQRNSLYEGKPLSEYINQWFMTKEGNVAQWLNAFKNHPAYSTENHETLIITNEFLDKIEGIVNPAEGQMSYIILKDRITDPYTSDRVTSAMRLLKNDNSTVVTLEINGKNYTKSMYEFYKELIFSQLVQFGTQKSKYSFVSLIPEEDIVEISKNAFDKLDASEWYENNEMYLNKWYDNKLVPEMNKNAGLAFSVFSEENQKVIIDLKWQSLLKSAGYIPNHSIYMVPAYKNKNLPYLKRTDLIRNEDNQIVGKNTRLYKRLDSEDYVGIYKRGNKEFVLFYEVNKKGDKFLNEFSNKPSLVNDYVQEINENELGNLVMNYDNSFEFEKIGDLISNDEFFNYEEDMIFESDDKQVVSNNNNLIATPKMEVQDEFSNSYQPNGLPPIQDKNKNNCS